MSDKKYLTDEEFREVYSGSPISLEDMAWGVRTNLDLHGEYSGSLVIAAIVYLQAIEDFQSALDAHDIELG